MTAEWRTRIYRIVTDSYLETAVWSSLDWAVIDDCGNSPPLDDNYGSYDFTEEAYNAAYADCKRFMERLELAEVRDDSDYNDLWEAAEGEQDYGHIGHDFWLTRNGHGAGFWDGDYGDYGDLICDMLYAEFGRYSEKNIFVNEEGKLEFDG